MAPGRFRPFSGQPRLGLHEPGGTTKWDPSEDEGTFRQYLEKHHDPNAPARLRLDDDWGYSFNSLGFRGEEYDAKAPLHIYTSGCSLTFGVGVKWEQTWPYVFKRRLAERIGRPLADINLMNFAQAGCPNDFIARTLVAQSKAVRPDLIIAHFSYKDRVEHVSENGIENIGPWVQTEAALNYYMHYTDELGMINALKNILWVQDYASLSGIPYVFSFVDVRDLDAPRFFSHPIVGELIDQVDRRVMTDFTILDFLADVGRPGHHPGPITHERFGGRFFDFAVERLGTRLPQPA